MLSTPSRRTVLLGMSALPMLSLPAWAAEERFTGDPVVGDENAPVTVYEYVSFSCPHCANFHKAVWPQLKEKYVDTGKVKFVLREVFFSSNDLRIALISRCGGPDRYYPMADLYLNQQRFWRGQPTEAQQASAIHQVAKQAGMPKDLMESCIHDQDFQKTLVANYQTNSGEHAVRSTPSFVINGVTHSNMSFEEFSELLDDALSS